MSIVLHMTPSFPTEMSTNTGIIAGHNTDIWVEAYVPWFSKMSTTEVSVTKQTITCSLYRWLLTALPVA